MKATRWLEDCYSESPDWKIAFAIAVHYVVLALSRMETDPGEPATDYLSLALQWNDTQDRDLIEFVGVGRTTAAPSPDGASEPHNASKRPV